MASLRMLCERYISIDDELQKLNAAILQIRYEKTINI